MSEHDIRMQNEFLVKERTEKQMLIDSLGKEIEKLIFNRYYHLKKQEQAESELSRLRSIIEGLECDRKRIDKVLPMD